MYLSIILSNTLQLSLFVVALRLALIQMAVGEDKGENIRKAIKLINDAKSKGSSLVVLPECFNCPYGTSKLIIFQPPRGLPLPAR